MGPAERDTRAAAFYCFGHTRDSRAMGLEDDLRAMLATRAGAWGVYARHLESGETVRIRASDVMPAQSSLKVGVLLTYTRVIGLGEDDPKRRVSLLEEDYELGSGVLRFLSPGLSPTLDDLAWLMIVVSDNIATRALVRELGGPQVVEADLAARGLPHLRLRESPEDSVGKFMATPHDLAEAYTHLDEHAREMLYRVDRAFLARRLPHWPTGFDLGQTTSLRVYSKAGWGRECVDAGLFETDDGSWIVAAMAKDLPDIRHRPDDEGPRTLADIGVFIYEAWGR